MAIEFNLGMVAGSLSSLRPLPLFRRFIGSTDDSRYKQPSRTRTYELHSTGRKKGGMGMGTTILQETSNESQERIILQKN